MPASKPNSTSSKTSSYQFTNSRPNSVKSTKARLANPRRVLPSRRIPQNTSTTRKIYSSDLSSDTKNITKPKKTAKSDFTVRQDLIDQRSRKETIDYCKSCGDIVPSSRNLKSSNSKSIDSKSDTKSSKSNKNGTHPANSNRNGTHPANSNRNGTHPANSNRNGTHPANSNKNGNTDKTKPESIKQYYKNENYRLTESAEDISNGIKKISLDTIKEVSEIHPSNSVFQIYPDDSEEDITFLDIEDQDSLQQLKEFRQKNYFECHSAKSRIRNKGSAISLQDHRCVYRFYLNDRLFPVPLSTDHNNQVRCVECHLPMELNVEDATKINGTIQAKVSIGKKNQDIMLLLPVKEPLIITEKRKEDKCKDREIVFFGVINLDGFGNSMFNSTLPGNSLALKYQKGYQEFQSKEDYGYRDLDKGDVIVI